MEPAILRKKCQEFGQEHLLQFENALSEEKRGELHRDVASLDLQEWQESFDLTLRGQTSDKSSVDERMTPIEAECCYSVVSSTREELEELTSVTLEAIAKGEVAVICLAGGQGTRLGSSKPKGMFDIGLLSHKTLYAIQAERILKLEQLSRCRDKLPMYIMTSEHTKEPTEKFLADNSHFGMKRENIVLFEQRMIPCFDFEGKILLSEESKVARSPDGNGGLYWALKNEGILDDMAKRGIKYVHVYCVDNVLVKVADPHFLGRCIKSGVESGNKVVEKAFPTEGVGVVSRVDGKVQVVEYSEISTEKAESRDPANGKLTFRAGNVCNHFFTTQFLEKVCSPELLKALPYHVAKKKIPCTSVEAGPIVPASPNGIKLEKFVFDVFQFSDSFLVWECLREEEFSPLKNADGEGKKDTPTTARNALYSLHKAFIEKAGGEIANVKTDEVPAVEISPFVSYGGEGLEAIVKGKTLPHPLSLDEQFVKVQQSSTN